MQNGLLELKHSPVWAENACGRGEGVISLGLEATAGLPDRPSMCVVFALDRSSSMSGRPIHSIKVAVSAIVAGLAPTDRVGLVVFDGNAQLLCPVEELHDMQRATLLERVDRIEAGYGTHLEDGLHLAYDAMPERRQHEKQIVVVLTDGLPSRGARDAKELAKITETARQEIGTSVLGFGRHFSSSIARRVARAGGGAVRHVNTPERATTIFAETIGIQALVVADDISITVEPAEGFGVEVIANDVVDTAAGESIARLSPMIGNEKTLLAVRITWNGSVDPGFHRVAKIKLSYVDVGMRARAEVQAELHLDFSEGELSGLCDSEAFVSYLDAVRNVVVYRASKLQADGQQALAHRAVSTAFIRLRKLPSEAEVDSESWSQTCRWLRELRRMFSLGDEAELQEWVTEVTDDEETGLSRIVDRSEVLASARDSIIGPLSEYAPDEGSDS